MKLNIKLNRFSEHMPRIVMDMSGSPQKVTFQNAILFGAGLSLLLIVTAYYIYSTYQVNQIMRIAESRSSLTEVKKPQVLGPEETDAIQKSLNQLSLPWDNLFASMEAVHTNKVVLLGLEPDPEKRTVHITAEAADVYLMLDYVRALSVQPSMHKVHLTSQTQEDNTKNQGVKFTIDGYWFQQ